MRASLGRLLLGKHEDLSSGLGSHIKNGAWLHTPVASAPYGVETRRSLGLAGSQPRSTVYEKSRLQRVKPRVIVQRHSVSSSGLHTCTHVLVRRTHTHRVVKCRTVYSITIGMDANEGLTRYPSLFSHRYSLF